jgi:nitrate reductase NapAB chaperone NapD
MKKKAQTRVLYLVIDSSNVYHILKYLSKVESLTGILKATLSKHFSKYKSEYQNKDFKVYKVKNVDLNGYYKNNFR